MAKLEDAFEIKMKRRGISPSEILAQELASVLSQVEGSIIAIAQKDPSALLHEGIGFALVGVRKGSAVYRLKPIAPNISRPAFEYFAQTVNDPEQLPRAARRGADELTKLSAKHNCVIELRSWAGSPQPVATIRPRRIEPKPQAAILEGETDIYGTVESVGGLDPKAHLRTSCGARIGFDIKQDQARILGARMYQAVGVRGLARWDSESLEIISFKLLEVLPYRQSSIIDAFDALRSEFGKHFDQIKDVDEFMKEVR